MRVLLSLQDIIAISCSWCKSAYHNKITCFMMQQIEEQCTLGIHAGIIIPPSWIIKLPKKVKRFLSLHFFDFLLFVISCFFIRSVGRTDGPIPVAMPGLAIPGGETWFITKNF